LRKRSDKTRSDKKKLLRGYADDEFVQADDEEDYNDPDNPQTVTTDTLTSEERESVKAQIIQDAYRNDEQQKHARRSMQEKRQTFTEAAVVKHVTLSTTIDMKAAIMIVLSGEGNVDLFVEKFDKLLLNNTFASFKRAQHHLFVNAALAQGEWKSRDLKSRQPAMCCLCGVHRHCRDAIVNFGNRVIGYVGSECIDRWMLLERVYQLRREILAAYGRGEDKSDADHFVQQIDELKRESLLTLQILANKFLPKDQQVSEDAASDEE